MGRFALRVLLGFVFFVCALTATAANYALSPDGNSVVRLTPLGSKPAQTLNPALLPPGFFLFTGPDGRTITLSYDAAFNPAGGGGAIFTALYGQTNAPGPGQRLDWIQVLTTNVPLHPGQGSPLVDNNDSLVSPFYPFTAGNRDPNLPANYLNFYDFSARLPANIPPPNGAITWNADLYPVIVSGNQITVKDALSWGWTMRRAPVGSTTGIFGFAFPALPTNFGSGTNSFSWGVGLPLPPLEIPGPGSSLTFTGANFNTTTNTPFSLGRLTYVNEPILTETGISSVGFRVGVRFDNVPEKNIAGDTRFTILETLNTGNPIADADIVGLGDFRYTFRVFEGLTASADLIGVLTTGLSVNPAGAAANASQFSDFPVDLNPSYTLRFLGFANPTAGSYVTAESLAVVATNAPGRFSRAGDAVTITATVVNTGGGAVSNVTASDTLGSTFGACAKTTLAPGEFTTCVGTYVATAVDVAARATLSSTVLANGETSDATLAPASDTISIAYLSPVGSITVAVNTTARDNTFDFASNIPGGSPIRLTTVNGAAARTYSDLAPGAYGFAPQNLPIGWKVAGLTCTAGGFTAESSALIQLYAGRAVTCTYTLTFDAAAVRDRTHAVIENFMGWRGRAMMSAAPTTQLSASRRTMGGRSEGVQTASAAGLGSILNFAGVGTDDSGKFMLAANLQDIAKGSIDPRFNIWLEGQVSYASLDDNANEMQGQFGVLYLGADYVLSPGILAGVLAQYDMSNLDTASGGVLGSSASGRGWMAGPYVGLRLAPGVFFDARATWGNASNMVSPYAEYEDRFDSARVLASARLTGEWRRDAWAVTPSLDVTYFRETQDSYIDSLDVFIDKEAVSLGRASFGAAVAYSFQTAFGAELTPHVGIYGLWDFDPATAGSPAPGIGIVRPREFVSKVDLGATYTDDNGVRIGVSASYEGLGSGNSETVAGKLSLAVPFN